MSWLDDLKVGDEVIIGGRNRQRIASVERLTKLYIVVDGIKFKKSNGFGPSDSWYKSFLREPKSKEQIEEIKNKNKKDRIVMKLLSFNYKELPLIRLEQIYKIIEEEKSNNE